jgi:hypothetical protein
MKNKVLLATVLAFALSPVGASGDRLSDEQVKSTVDQVQKNFDRWKDGLERANMDDAVIRSAAGTTDVKQFLKGFDDDLDKLDDKFESDYSAIPEAMAVLRKGSDVDRRYRRLSGAASSEWTALSNSLGALARAYGLDWPMESLDVQPVRLNDRELAARLEAMGRAVKTVGKESDKAAGKNNALPKPERDRLKADVKQLETTVKDLRSRINDDKPASAEAKTLLQQVAALQPRMAALPALSTPGETAWNNVTGGAQLIARSFGEPFSLVVAR